MLEVELKTAPFRPAFRRSQVSTNGTSRIICGHHEGDILLVDVESPLQQGKKQHVRNSWKTIEQKIPNGSKWGIPSCWILEMQQKHEVEYERWCQPSMLLKCTCLSYPDIKPTLLTVFPRHSRGCHRAHPSARLDHSSGGSLRFHPEPMLTTMCKRLLQVNAANICEPSMFTTLHPPCRRTQESACVRQSHSSAECFCYCLSTSGRLQRKKSDVMKYSTKNVVSW